MARRAATARPGGDRVGAAQALFQALPLQGLQGAELRGRGEQQVAAVFQIRFAIQPADQPGLVESPCRQHRHAGQCQHTRNERRHDRHVRAGAPGQHRREDGQR